jgi:tripartite-type tricarboxylate transporter receptor subunit TctC
MPSTTTRSVSRTFMLVLALGCLFPVVAHTQNFPARPVRLVVPWAAGGSTDSIGRILAQKLT